MGLCVTKKEFNELTLRVLELEIQNLVYKKIIDEIVFKHNENPDGIAIRDVDYIGTIIKNNYKYGQ